MIAAHNNKSSQPSIPVKPVQRRRRVPNKNTKKKANCGENQNRKTTKMLTKRNWVML